MGHDEAIEHVRSTFLDAGFGVATEFSTADLPNETVDVGQDPYTAVRASPLEMADRAPDASALWIGALFQCNVV